MIMQPQTQDLPYLVMLSPGSSQGRRIPLTRENLLVGRDPASDIQFDDMRVSRSHAALSRRAGRYFVQDLGSSGGTWSTTSPALAHVSCTQATWSRSPPCSCATAPARLAMRPA
ncbi:MAG: FHA domain-containing protein [Propionibacteriaceae bacterium]|nr:FHA domain-containing protein [Propionibacteriaceae bacterium]